MITADTVARGLRGSEGAVGLTLAGDPNYGWTQLAPEAIEAAWVISDVTDAVRVVDGDTVVGTVDREGLGEIQGVVLSREVARQAVAVGFENASELEQVVRSMGYVWSTVRIASSTS